MAMHALPTQVSDLGNEVFWGNKAQVSYGKYDRLDEESVKYGVDNLEVKPMKDLI